MKRYRLRTPGPALTDQDAARVHHAIAAYRRAHKEEDAARRREADLAKWEGEGGSTP